MAETATDDGIGEILLRVVAAVFALSWFVFPGFGLIDLWVVVDGDASWPILLEAVWGLYMTLFVGLPFAAIAVRGRSRSTPAVGMLYVATCVLAVAAVLSFEAPAVALAAVIGLETVIVTGSPRKQIAGVTWGHVSPGLLVAVALAAVPAMAYAWTMWSRNRADLPDQDITAGVDHYSVQGAYALAVLVLVALAAIWPPGRLFLGVIAGLSVTVLGTVSWFWYPLGGSFAPPWSAACIAWGAAVVAITIVTRPHALASGLATAR